MTVMERIIAGDTAEFERALVLGLSRSQVGTSDPLGLLTLVGRRLKCARRQLPPASGVADRFDPAAPHVPHEARKLIVKLMSGKDASTTDGIAFAVSRAIKAAGLGLHPFDYAQLEEFIASHAHERTTQERAWLARVRPGRTSSEEPYADGPITEEMLPSLGRAQKLQFLRDLRSRDADAARRAIETLWPQEPANVRADFLILVQKDISPADRDFLEAVLSDRAQSVKDIARSMLGRIRGTEAFADRMTALKSRIEVASAGFLRRSKVLKYKRPADADARKDPGNEQWQLLDGLRFSDVAEALGETAPSLLAAAEASDQAGLIPLLLMQLAAMEGLLDLVERHHKILDGQPPRLMLGFIEQVLSVLKPQHHDRFLSIAIRPGSLWSGEDAAAGAQICAAIGRPLPHASAQLVIDQAAADYDRIAPYLDAIAPLIPSSLSADFIAKLGQSTRRAVLYHQLLPILQSRHT